MFDALVHKRIDVGDIEFEIYLADIFHLNQMAIRQELDMVKISYATFGRIRHQYHLLESGSALGHNCGPLLISKNPHNVNSLIDGNRLVAIPGYNTTANLLLDYFAPQLIERKPYIFHEIMPAIQSEEVAAGVIIHENRFTYQKQGLRLIQDLGEYWEQRTGLPIPLGAIVANKKLGERVIAELERQMTESVAYAFAHPEASLPYVRQHAQEMDEAVMKAHIDLYVNEYSLGLGEKGHAAVNKLLSTYDTMTSKA